MARYPCDTGLGCDGCEHNISEYECSRNLMGYEITKKDLGGNAIGCNSQPIYCVACSPMPLDYLTAVFFKVGKVGIKQGTENHKPHLDIAMCPKCSKQIAY